MTLRKKAIGSLFIRLYPRKQVKTIKLGYQDRKVKYSLLSNLNYVTKMLRTLLTKEASTASISHSNLIIFLHDLLLTQILALGLCLLRVPNHVSTSCVVFLPFHCVDRSREKGTSYSLLFCLSR